MNMFSIRSQLVRFRRDENGVALVEFALFLPLFLLSFFVIVEFARVFFSYQGAVVGVRDAARYLARVAPAGICEGAVPPSGGGNAGGTFTTITNTNGDDKIEEIILRNMDNEDGALPAKVFLRGVTYSYVCVIAPGVYRQDEVPIGQVSAAIEIELPLGGILELNGQPLIPNITHTVTDQSRIFGV